MREWESLCTEGRQVFTLIVETLFHQNTTPFWTSRAHFNPYRISSGYSKLEIESTFSIKPTYAAFTINVVSGTCEHCLLNLNWNCSAELLQNGLNLKLFQSRYSIPRSARSWSGEERNARCDRTNLYRLICHRELMMVKRITLDNVLKPINVHVTQDDGKC